MNKYFISIINFVVLCICIGEMVTAHCQSRDLDGFTAGSICQTNTSKHKEEENRGEIFQHSAYDMENIFITPVQNLIQLVNARLNCQR